jgi:hypothetical protein
LLNSRYSIPLLLIYMKVIHNSFPIFREAKVINTTDPEKLGRIQLKIYPELSEIADTDCPWCFSHTGGVHGKSFGVPLVDQLVTCVVWNRYFNEITFLPFNITNPTEHLFDDWIKNQRSEVVDMETDPEEEHLIVEQFEDDFTVFHDTKNNQHGFLHPTGTYLAINKDGSIWVQSVKKYTFHNKDSDLIFEADSDTGNITFKTKGELTEEVDKDVTQTYKAKQTTEVTGDAAMTVKANWKVAITGNTEIKTTGNTKIESSGPCNIESSAMTTVKGSSMVVVDAPVLKFTGNKSMGMVIPSGSGVCCAITVCPLIGLAHVG